jgi:hypothetical protein
VDVFRVSGVFPTVSSDGSNLAFVDNEFKAVCGSPTDDEDCVSSGRYSPWEIGNGIFSSEFRDFSIDFI